MYMVYSSARRLWYFFAIMAVSAILAQSLQAQGDTLLEVYIGDHEAIPGEQGFAIPIYMSNHYDSVIALGLFLQLNRPDIMEFQEAFDTSGTLTSGWEWVAVNTIVSPYNLKVVGIADFPGGTNTPSIPPSQASCP
jgi:hypothetical protein